MFTLLIILSIAYVFLKVSNTRAEFARRDAEKAAKEAAAAEAREAMVEEEEIRRSAVDVDADTIETSEPEDVAFVVEEERTEDPEEIVIEVPEYEIVN